MDEVTWIEVLTRQRDVASRQRFDGRNIITIGRAYDNDVVVDDVHVAAHHLRLARGDDGVWIAEDLGSINGVRLEGARVMRGPIVLDGSGTLQIGATFVRLRTSSQPVAAELPLVRGTPRWPIALACFAFVLGVALLDLWRAETAEPKLIRYLSPVLVLAAVVAAWTCVWSVLSRILTGHARFGTHLLVICAGLALYTMYDESSELGAFAFSWTALARSVYIGAWVAFAAVCLAHLRVLGRAHLPIKVAAVIALAALGVTVQTLKLSEWRATYGQASTLERLEPPSIRIARPQSQPVFFTRSADLRAALDQARSQEPEGDAAADE
ncbi:MAG: FHA domain-containing protein [Dokdonella sp.]|uniref:FHA domain-containing protein n=1 Tax=Dokdonella sp. TaxID=2291710 RepID=UPI003264DCA6